MVNLLNRNFWLRSAVGAYLLTSLNALACPALSYPNQPPLCQVACATPPCYAPCPPRFRRRPPSAERAIIADESIAPPEEVPSPSPDVPNIPPAATLPGPRYQNPPLPSPSGDDPLQSLGRGINQLLIALLQLITVFWNWLFDPQERLFRAVITGGVIFALWHIRQHMKYAKEVKSWAEHTDNLALQCPQCKLPTRPINGTYNRYLCQDGHQSSGDVHRL